MESLDSYVAASLGLEATNSLPEHQAFTSADVPLDVPKIRSDALLIELIERWPAVSDEIKRALLATVRACASDRQGKSD